MCMCAHMCECVFVHVRACVTVCMCEKEKQRERERIRDIESQREGVRKGGKEREERKGLGGSGWSKCRRVNTNGHIRDAALAPPPHPPLHPPQPCKDLARANHVC